MPEQTIGIIGLGIMGSAVSANLLKAGFDVIGYDILIERMRALEGQGGRGATSVRALAEEADIMISLLPSVRALNDVVSGDKGLVPVGRKGSILVECSTLPLEAKGAARRALERVSIVMLDCPLSGTGAQAVTKDLVVYASGDEDAVARCRNVFDGFARASHYTGPFGNGSKLKFVANLLVSIHNVAAAEAFVLGMKAGLAPELIYEVVASGAGTSRMFEVRGPMMVEGRYDQVTMKNDVWQKDIQIITDFARDLGSPIPLFAAAAQLYAAALAQGRAKEDTAAVCAVLEDMAGLKRSGHA